MSQDVVFDRERERRGVRLGDFFLCVQAEEVKKKKDLSLFGFLGFRRVGIHFNDEEAAFSLLAHNTRPN